MCCPCHCWEEPQGTAGLVPPPPQLFFSLALLLVVGPILGWRGKGMWGLGRALGKRPRSNVYFAGKEDLQGPQSCFSGRRGGHPSSLSRSPLCLALW